MSGGSRGITPVLSVGERAMYYVYIQSPYSPKPTISLTNYFLLFSRSVTLCPPSFCFAPLRFPCAGEKCRLMMRRGKERDGGPAQVMLGVRVTMRITIGRRCFLGNTECPSCHVTSQYTKEVVALLVVDDAKARNSSI